MQMEAIDQWLYLLDMAHQETFIYQRDTALETPNFSSTSTSIRSLSLHDFLLFAADTIHGLTQRPSVCFYCFLKIQMLESKMVNIKIKLGQ